MIHSNTMMPVSVEARQPAAPDCKNLRKSPASSNKARLLIFAGDVYKLFERTADAAFVVTLEGEILFWNAAAEQLFGYSEADVLNKTCCEVFEGRDALGTAVYEGECSIQRCAARTESIPRFDLEVMTGCGARKWVSVSTIVFEDSRRYRRLIVHLCHDISARKKSELAFARMVELSKHVVSIGDTQSAPAPVEPLSDQEKRILTLFARAKNSSQVAKELRITLPTLRNHLHAINQKLRTHNRLEAVLHAIKRGLISTADGPFTLVSRPLDVRTRAVGDDVLRLPADAVRAVGN